MRDKKEKRHRIHLRLPTAMLETSLRPTGCRNSPEAEASWRLAAAVVAIRELKPRGVLPIFRETKDYREVAQNNELHFPLGEEDYQLLTEIAKEEGGSRGELVRKLLLTTQRIIDDCPCLLSHDGLAAEMICRFSPLFSLFPAEW